MGTRKTRQALLIENGAGFWNAKRSELRAHETKRDMSHKSRLALCTENEVGSVHAKMTQAR
ncbi:hypothetical protein DVH24_024742 [Malus domestica]|uniref:Uncharacterized protein n=1 Tax=Malus domestica TaxID=3750 RepID=A0A498JH89_MALDO|nr:hypothetical protein DVH24_024742 [Malus domestica]